MDRNRKVRSFMEERSISPKREPSWYENDQPILQYLAGYRKHTSKEEDQPFEKPSWLKMMKNPQLK